jgi:hypothetical protein
VAWRANREPAGPAPTTTKSCISESSLPTDKWLTIGLASKEVSNRPGVDLLPALKREDSSVGNPTS